MSCLIVSSHCHVTFNDEAWRVIRCTTSFQQLLMQRLPLNEPTKSQTDYFKRFVFGTQRITGLFQFGRSPRPIFVYAARVDANYRKFAGACCVFCCLLLRHPQPSSVYSALPFLRNLSAYSASYTRDRPCAVSWMIIWDFKHPRGVYATNIQLNETHKRRRVYGM